MTALFFISRGAPSGGGARPGAALRGAGDQAGRRVDLAALAQMFAEPDAAPPPRAAPRPVLRLMILALILLGAVGDMVLVAKPGPLSTGAGFARSAGAVGRSGPKQA